MLQEQDQNLIATQVWCWSSISNSCDNYDNEFTLTIYLNVIMELTFSSPAAQQVQRYHVQPQNEVVSGKVRGEV